MFAEKKKRWKKIAILFYIFLLLFFLGTSIDRVSRCTETEIATFSPAELSQVTSSDMTVTLSEDQKTVTFIPTSDDAFFTIAYNTQNADTITLHLASPTLEGEFVAVCGTEPTLTQNHRSAGVLYSDGYACHFRMPVDAWQHFQIESNVPLAISRVTVSSTETATAFAPNFVSLALFVLTACFGVLAQSKWKLFDPLLHFCKRELSLCKELLASKRLLFVLHMLAYASAALYFLMAFADFTFIFVSVSFGKALFFTALVAAIFFFVDRAWVRKDAHPAVLFLGFMLLVGSAAVLTLPASTVVSWDDDYHFSYAAYPSALIAGNKMSLADFMVQFRQFSGKTFAEDPERHLALLLHDATKHGRTVLSFLPPDFWETVRALPIVTWLAAPVAALYYAFIYLVYVPSGAAFWLCRAVGADYFTLLTLGKLANFALYSFVSYFGIRHLRRGGAIFVGVALIPSAFFVATNFTCDAWVTAFLLAGMAMFVSVFQSEVPLSRKKLVAMTAFVAIGCGPKAIYFFMLFPFLFLPRRCFKSKKTAVWFRIAVILVAIAIFVSFALPFLINTDSKTDLRGGGNVDAGEQIIYILTHPLAYAKTILNFLANYLSLSNATHFFSYMGYIGSLEAFAPSLYIVLLLFASFTGKGKGDRGTGYGRLRLVSFLTVFITLVLVATSLYVGFTSVGADTVLGCQFRYVFPVLPLLLYALPSAQIDNRAKAHRYHFLTVGGMALLCAYCFYKIYFIEFL